MKKKKAVAVRRAEAEIRLIDAQATATLLSSCYQYFKIFAWAILLSISLLFGGPDFKIYEIFTAISEFLSKLAH